MVNAVGKLSQEDLSRWRMTCADKELVDTCYPGMSVQEARNALLKYYGMMDEFFTTYNLNVEEIENYFISPLTGHILQSD